MEFLSWATARTVATGGERDRACVRQGNDGTGSRFGEDGTVLTVVPWVSDLLVHYYVRVVREIVCTEAERAADLEARDERSDKGERRHKWT